VGQSSQRKGGVIAQGHGRGKEKSFGHGQSRESRKNQPTNTAPKKNLSGATAGCPDQEESTPKTVRQRNFGFTIIYSPGKAVGS